MNIDIMEGIETTAEWRDAEKLFAEYVRVNDIKPGGFLVQQEQISKNTLHALIRTYVGESRSFTYDSQRGPAQAEKLPIELDSPTVEFHGVLTLDGFAAPRAFDLSPTIQIRPVSQADLRVLNELHLAPFPSAVFGWPSTGWWVADFKVLNRRGGLVEVNGVYEHHEALTLALRAFKEGGCNVRMGYTTAVSPLQETGIIQGGLAERLSSLHSTYSISEEEIPRLVEFWKRFESLIHKADHYLQASVRRLRTAGGRHQREDALVDFVIGLESLLSTGNADDRGEISYRLSIRGCVVLAPKGPKRRMVRRQLRDVYALRSAIVHGAKSDPSKLDTCLPIAESALRNIWRWFFDHHSDKANNEAGVEAIDDELVGL